MIYTIVGETGEYSDHQDWDVGAFMSKEAAYAICQKLNDWCKEKGVDSKGKGRNWSFLEKPIDDPNFQLDYTGTKYCVVELPLKG